MSVPHLEEPLRQTACCRAKSGARKAVARHLPSQTVIAFSARFRYAIVIPISSTSIIAQRGASFAPRERRMRRQLHAKARFGASDYRQSWSIQNVKAGRAVKTVVLKPSLGGLTSSEFAAISSPRARFLASIASHFFAPVVRH